MGGLIGEGGGVQVTYLRYSEYTGFVYTHPLWNLRRRRGGWLDPYPNT